MESGVATTAIQHAPSFDCRTTSAPDERTICDNAGLVELERGMMETYRSLTVESGGTVPQAARQYSKVALQDRHAYGTNVDCITGILLAQKVYFTEMMRRHN